MLEFGSNLQKNELINPLEKYYYVIALILSYLIIISRLFGFFQITKYKKRTCQPFPKNIIF